MVIQVRRGQRMINVDSGLNSLTYYAIVNELEFLTRLEFVGEYPPQDWEEKVKTSFSRSLRRHVDLKNENEQIEIEVI